MGDVWVATFLAICGTLVFMLRDRFGRSSIASQRELFGPRFGTDPSFATVGFAIFGVLCVLFAFGLVAGLITLKK